MELVVCLKQVPDPEHFSKITYDPVTRNIIREGIPAIINPLDRHALEAALQIKEAASGRVTVISMGPPQARPALEEALATGADRAVLLSDRAFSGADTLATARTLSAAICKLFPCDVVLCGSETVDGATGQVAPQLAEMLGLPHTSQVRRVQVQGDTLEVERGLENGYVKLILKPPCLLAVGREADRPRLPTVAGIMEAASKELLTWDLADLGLSAQEVGLDGSAIQVVDVFPLGSGRRREVFTGAPQEAVKAAVRRLVELEAL
jgi:electron transfer flavoprotein beta subunit